MRSLKKIRVNLYRRTPPPIHTVEVAKNLAVLTLLAVDAAEFPVGAAARLETGHGPHEESITSTHATVKRGCFDIFSGF